MKYTEKKVQKIIEKYEEKIKKLKEDVGCRDIKIGELSMKLDEKDREFEYQRQKFKDNCIHSIELKIWFIRTTIWEKVHKKLLKSKKFEQLKLDIKN